MPTELGFVVSDLLVEHFPHVFDIGFTSQLEEELDEIAAGDRAWVPTMQGVLRSLHRDARRRPRRRMERVKLKDEPSGEICEKCGRADGDQAGRFGKFLACSGFPECRNAQTVAGKDRHDLPELPRGRDRRAAHEEGSHLLRLQPLPGVRFVAWNKPVEHPCRSAAIPYMLEVGRRGQLKCPSCGHIGSTLGGCVLETWQP